MSEEKVKNEPETRSFISALGKLIANLTKPKKYDFRTDEEIRDEHLNCKMLQYRFYYKITKLLKRLIDEGSADFVFSSIDDYKMEYFKECENMSSEYADELFKKDMLNLLKVVYEVMETKKEECLKETIEESFMLSHTEGNIDIKVFTNGATEEKDDTDDEKEDEVELPDQTEG